MNTRSNKINLEYLRKTAVAAQIATDSYRAAGLNGMHAELVFLRYMDADPVTIGELECLYHRQVIRLAEQGLRYW